MDKQLNTEIPVSKVKNRPSTETIFKWIFFTSFFVTIVYAIIGFTLLGCGVITLTSDISTSVLLPIWGLLFFIWFPSMIIWLKASSCCDLNSNNGTYHSGDFGDGSIW